MAAPLQATNQEVEGKHNPGQNVHELADAAEVDVHIGDGQEAGGEQCDAASVQLSSQQVEPQHAESALDHCGHAQAEEVVTEETQRQGHGRIAEHGDFTVADPPQGTLRAVDEFPCLKSMRCHVAVHVEG